MNNEHNNAPAVPQGWRIARVDSENAVVINGPIGGCVAVKDADIARTIPESILYELACAMLAATPAPAPAQEPAKETFQSRHEREFMERMAGNHGKLTEFCAALESFTHDYQRLYSTYKSYRDMISDLIKERDSLRDQVAKPAQDAGLTDEEIDENTVWLDPDPHDNVHCDVSATVRKCLAALRAKGGKHV